MAEDVLAHAIGDAVLAHAGLDRVAEAMEQAAVRDLCRRLDGGAGLVGLVGVTLAFADLTGTGRSGEEPA
jgi:hypothetical protein